MRPLSSHPNPLLYRRRLPRELFRASLIYLVMRRVFHVTLTSFCKVRVFNRHYEPSEGSVVYICNHQSFLDPILMSYALKRPMNYMARDTLFRNGLWAGIIRSANAFPVKRNTSDTGAIKEAMRRLKAGRQLVIFAEGTRTEDGRIGPLLPGVALLAQRAAKWTVPVVIDGAFEAWPKAHLLPRLGSIVVQYGQPIHQEIARTLPAAEFLAGMRRTMIEMQAEVRRRVGRPPLVYSPDQNSIIEENVDAQV